MKNENTEPEITNAAKEKRKELMRSLKFVLFSISAGVIQVVSFTLLNELVKWPGVEQNADYGPNYFIALALSVIWNFTFNRKFTFKSASNVPIAMLKVLGYYAVFTPLSIHWGIMLERHGWNEYLILGITMIVNFITEFLFQRFVVFRKSLDTNDIAEKERERERLANASDTPDDEQQ